MRTRPGCVLHDGEHGVLRGKNPRYASNADFNLARSASLGTHSSKGREPVKQQAQGLSLADCVRLCRCCWCHVLTHIHTRLPRQRIPARFALVPTSSGEFLQSDNDELHAVAWCSLVDMKMCHLTATNIFTKSGFIWK
jgi:hypothetical protein